VVAAAVANAPLSKSFSGQIRDLSIPGPSYTTEVEAEDYLIDNAQSLTEWAKLITSADPDVACTALLDLLSKNEARQDGEWARRALAHWKKHHGKYACQRVKDLADPRSQLGTVRRVALKSFLNI